MASANEISKQKTANTNVSPPIAALAVSAGFPNDDNNLQEREERLGTKAFRVSGMA